jgi:dienelactone hydrolase
VDDIVGIDSEGRDRTNKAGYQHDFAIQTVEHGLAAVAIEPLGFGCRRDPAAKKKGLGTSSCQPAAGAALLFGETMIAWRVWDVMRTIDWIETRKELDARRVGCMGISGGGTCTVFASALEPRIRAAMVSGYLNTFRDSIMCPAYCTGPRCTTWRG